MMSECPTAQAKTMLFGETTRDTCPDLHGGLAPENNRMWTGSPRVSPLAHLLLVTALGLSVVVAKLHTFRGCAVRDFSFMAHKPGCRGLRIQTEACWGRCHTWEKPLPEHPYIQRHHRVCTYSRMRHLTARLPGCQPNVSPLYHYPHALQCDCSVCSSLHTECQTF